MSRRSFFIGRIAVDAVLVRVTILLQQHAAFHILHL
jgi:hypothetical protein